MATGDGSSPRRANRAWTVALVALVVATAGSLPWTIDRWGEWTSSLQDRAAAAPEVRLEQQRGLEGSASVLLIVVDESQSTRALGLLTRPEARDGVLALIPADLFDLLPGYGEFSLTQATTFEGPGLTETVVENVLGVRVDEVLLLGPGDLTAAIAEPITVDLNEPFVAVGPGGGEELVADAGEGVYGPEIVESLLITRGDGDALQWLERQGAAWEAVLTAVGSDAAMTDRLAAHATRPDLATGVLASVAAAPVQIGVVPVERAAVAGDADGFTIDGAGVEGFVASRMSHLALASGPRHRVEVLNGNGRVLTTRPVTESLIRSGFRVVRTGNAERFDLPETLVVAQGRENRPAAEQAIAAMGVGTLQLELRSPSGVVDVSIIVGLDVPAGEG